MDFQPANLALVHRNCDAELARLNERFGAQWRAGLSPEAVEKFLATCRRRAAKIQSYRRNALNYSRKKQEAP